MARWVANWLLGEAHVSASISSLTSRLKVQKIVSSSAKPSSRWSLLSCLYYTSVHMVKAFCGGEEVRFPSTWQPGREVHFAFLVTVVLPPWPLGLHLSRPVVPVQAKGAIPDHWVRRNGDSRSTPGWSFALLMKCPATRKTTKNRPDVIHFS